MNRDKLSGCSAERIDLVGARVLETINRKDEIGRAPLEMAISVTRKAYDLIGNACNSKFMPIGSSLFGTHIKVPDEYMKKREVSRVIDILVKGRSEEVSVVMEKGGWKRIEDTKKYFSMKIQLDDGSISCIGTMSDQTLFVNDRGFFLSSIGVPSVFYQRNREDRLKAVRFEEVPTIGLSIAHKIIRGNRQDISDLAAIAMSNRVGDILGKDGDATVMEVMRKKAEASIGWGEEFHRRLVKLSAKLVEIGRVHGIDMSDSVAWFERTGHAAKTFIEEFKGLKRQG